MPSGENTDGTACGREVGSVDVVLQDDWDTVEIRTAEPSVAYCRQNPIAGMLYDVTADGQRSLVNELVDQTPASITWVVDWTADLGE